MNPTRRSLLRAMVAAPAIILTPGLLMACKGKLWVPPELRLVEFFLTGVNENLQVGHWLSIARVGGGSNLYRVVAADHLDARQTRVKAEEMPLITERWDRWEAA